MHYKKNKTRKDHLHEEIFSFRKKEFRKSQLFFFFYSVVSFAQKVFHHKHDLISMCLVYKSRRKVAKHFPEISQDCWCIWLLANYKINTNVKDGD